MVNDGLTVSSGNNNRTSLAGTGCVVLFGLPFAGVGTAVLVAGVQRLLAGNYKEGIFFTAFGLIFAFVGFGLMAGAFYSRREEKKKLARQAEFPQEPWRWREDWAKGRVESQATSRMAAIWIFAIFWNAISSPVIPAIQKEWAHGKKEVLFALLFPLVGLGLLAWAIRTTLQRRKFGRPALKLLNPTGVVGGQLAGLVEVPAKLRPEGGFQTRLACVEKVMSRRSGERHTQESVRWEHQGTVSQDLLAHELDRTAIPVQFDIPASLPDSSMDNENPRIIWRVTVQAALPGVDFSESYEVPVFRTADSPLAKAAPLEDVPRWDKPVEQFTPPVGTRIRVEPLPAGGCSVVFPAARNLGAVFILFLLASIFGAAIGFMIVKKAPIFFPIIFGLFEVFMVFGVFHMLCHSSRVEVTGRALRLQSRWLFFSKQYEWTIAEIADVYVRRGMQAGDKSYYDVKLKLRDGRDRELGSSVPGSEYAAWLAAVIREAMGLKGNDSDVGLS